MDGEVTPEEQAEIDAAIAEADLGGGVPAEEVLRQLRVRAMRDVRALRAAEERNRR